MPSRISNRFKIHTSFPPGAPSSASSAAPAPVPVAPAAAAAAAASVPVAVAAPAVAATPAPAPTPAETPSSSAAVAEPSKEEKKEEAKEASPARAQEPEGRSSLDKPGPVITQDPPAVRVAAAPAAEISKPMAEPKRPEAPSRAQVAGAPPPSSGIILEFLRTFQDRSRLPQE